ncbi:helix-turn-helix domain-containing protein [Phytohabitans aurantiacus]|nr:helix-turn-helix transcriptional regulator [Phytohabitans aurantiacus]
MRELRDQRGLTLKFVAAHLGVEFSTLARYERAEWPFREEYVAALLNMYGVYDEDERVELVDLARGVWRVNHWDRDFKTKESVTPFVDYTWLETRATEVNCFGTMYVPDLLQTDAYADALVASGTKPLLPQHDLGLVTHRLRDRQQAFFSNDGLRLHTIIEESVLHRPIGGVGVLGDQILYLDKLTRRSDDKITIQVLPTRAGGHPGLDGCFTLLAMADFPPVAYVSHLAGRFFIEAAHAEYYARTYEQLREAAHNVPESAALVAELAQALTGVARVSV